MRELFIIIWSILALVFGFLLRFTLKQENRKLGKYAMIFKLLLVLLTFIISFLTYWLFNKSIQIIWISRLVIFAFGCLYVYALYSRPWTMRHVYNFKEDAFLPEFFYVIISALIMAISFTTAPQFFGFVAYSVDVSRSLWDAPLCFLLPFLILKLSDFSSQVPFKEVENPWVFPIERINPSNWPWKNLIQVNFELKKSLEDEYNLFSWTAQPWIEAPKEIALGSIFQLCIQERRARKDLVTIQDMGDEYDGPVQFCWLFMLKRKWYYPPSWFRQPRYLNPDLSITANKLRKGDVIIVKRIPGDGAKSAVPRLDNPIGHDPDKTIIIQR